MNFFETNSRTNNVINKHLTMIKKTMLAEYSAPVVSVMSMETECGFAQSFGEEGRAGKLTYDSAENDITF